MRSRISWLVVMFLSFLASGVVSQDLTMVKLEGGAFERKDNQGNVQTVSVSPFLIADSEVTVQEWIDYLKSLPKPAKYFLNDPQHYVARLASFIDAGNKVKINLRWPAYFISWGEALEYCNWLSKKEGLTPVYRVVKDLTTDRYTSASWDTKANGYRLPTEAEWEFASGISSTELTAEKMLELGWLRNNSGDSPHEIRTMPANYLKLYDMFGNVSEFCWDLYNQNYFRSGNLRDPTGPTTFFADDSDDPKEEIRVVRGGGWIGDAFEYANSPRGYYTDYFAGSVGFRLARNLDR